MNLALATLAVLTTTPAVRCRLAIGPDPSKAVRRAALGGLALLGGLTVLIGPLIATTADVSAPTARIAAGLVMAITVLPDLWRQPVVASTTDPEWHAGVVPVVLPELFGPPLAAALTAAAIDLSVAPTVGLVGTAVAFVALVDRIPGARSPNRMLRAVIAMRAAAALAIGLALVMSGVYDI